MRKKIISGILATIVLTTGLVSGCGNDDKTNDSKKVQINASGLPIVKDKLTVKMVAPVPPLTPAYNDMTIFKTLEKDTNIHVDWNNIPDSDYDTKKSLLLSSGDLPDAFYNGKFSDQDIDRYSKDGSIIPLNDLIDKYMPNVKKLFEEEPDLKKFITSPDGKIYSLPNGEELGSGKEWIAAMPHFMFINKKWLDKLGLKAPTTLDELHDVLVAFKDKDPNGDGKKNEIPLSFLNMWWCADIGTLFGGFGVPDINVHQATDQVNNVLDHMNVKDGKVYYAASQPEYKDAISYFSKWVKEGLIDKEAFTYTDEKAFLSKGKNPDNNLGAFMWWEETEVVGADREKDYVQVGPLKGPDGKLVVGNWNGTPWGRGAVVLTKKAAEDGSAEAIARWYDELYAPKMAAQIHWGPIGEAFKEESGKLVQSIPKGEDPGEYRRKVAPNGVGVVTAKDFQTIVDPEPRAKVRMDRIKQFYSPVSVDEKIGSLFYTSEENAKIAEIKPDLQNYVAKKRAQWLMNGNVDAEWDQYLSDLKKLRLDEYLQIIQAAYDRMNKTK
jgi:putative aldouronate transport system substrate-binding protein